VIPKAEVLALGAEWQLDVGVIEKDYVLGWLLAAIANETELRGTWVFKGGTCLRKCYYETYRFSEDLDFTVIDGGPEEPDALLPIFERVAGWLRDESGIELVLDERSFARRKNRRGNPTTSGRIAYRGPNPPPSLPKVKIDITSDEVLIARPVRRTIVHPYSDPLAHRDVISYSLVELLAEKLRALAERCRPRDLYDVVHIHRHPDLLDQAPAVAAMLARKSEYAGIEVPTAASIHASPFRGEIEQEWGNMLAHQLPMLPPFAAFWESVEQVFEWLEGRRRLIALPRAELGRDDLDPSWAPPQAMASWRRGVPIGLIRAAGANRLKIVIDYRAEQGRQGPRVVEPYALRRTRAGNVVLYVVNDRGFLRSYRVDRIAGARATDQPFAPRYRVEF
jgi:predicted nucleotidyltransferase component of viral defense system